ncbi:hypothetical protein BH11CYA1_BH11CYA1_44830 [soil metagenome]
MATGQNASQPLIPLNTEAYGDALAHVIRVVTTEQGNQEQVLGQAWLCGFHKLITCGHVIDAFIGELETLVVRFPQSGNRYPISEIKLHPSFMRDPQLNQLVKFDVALLVVDLSYPESEARPLPIAYDRNLPNQLALTAVRFPTHLGQFSAALNPLAQMGRLLGRLRKEDNYHLLHDLALSPGDSGSAIFDDYTVVALHCGDTASLPGLNLPTTSIRLALWIDALKDLGIEPNAIVEEPSTTPSAVPLVAAFIAMFVLSLAGLGWFLASKDIDGHKVEKGQVEPINLQFNRPRNGYRYGEEAKILLTSRSSCNVYVFGEVPQDQLKSPDDVKVYRCYPPEEFKELSLISKGQIRSIDTLGPYPFLVDFSRHKLHVFALNLSVPKLVLKPAYEINRDEPGKSKILDDSNTLKVALALEEKYPESVMHIVMDGPVADPKLPPVERKKPK